MFGFKKDIPTTDPANKPGLFSRLRSQLGKTRATLTEGMSNLFLGAKQIDDELLEELETHLL